MATTPQMRTKICEYAVRAQVGIALESDLVGGVNGRGKLFPYLAALT